MPKFIYIIHLLCYVLFSFYNKLYISANSSAFASQSHCHLLMQYGGLHMFQKTKGNVVLLFPYFPSTSLTTPFLLTCLKALFLLLLSWA